MVSNNHQAVGRTAIITMSLDYAKTQQDVADSVGTTIEELNEYLKCSAANCDGHYVVRINSKTKHNFFGCSRYPDCKSTRNTSDVEEDLGEQFLGVVPDDDPGFRWDE